MNFPAKDLLGTESHGQKGYVLALCTSGARREDLITEWDRNNILSDASHVLYEAPDAQMVSTTPGVPCTNASRSVVRCA